MALFLAVIEQGCAPAVQAAKSVAPDAPVRERLRAAIEGDVAWARAHEPFARVLLRDCCPPTPDLVLRLFLEGAAEPPPRAGRAAADGADQNREAPDER